MTAAPACAGLTTLFYADDDESIAKAKAICSRPCPTAVRCLFDALRRGERFGVWGGLSADERAELVADLRQRAATDEERPATAGDGR